MCSGMAGAIALSVLFLAVSIGLAILGLQLYIISLLRRNNMSTASDRLTASVGAVVASVAANTTATGVATAEIASLQTGPDETVLTSAADALDAANTQLATNNAALNPPPPAPATTAADTSAPTG